MQAAKLCLLPLAVLSQSYSSYNSKEGRCSLARQVIGGGLARRMDVGHWMCLIEVGTAIDILDHMITFSRLVCQQHLDKYYKNYFQNYRKLHKYFKQSKEVFNYNFLLDNPLLILLFILLHVKCSLLYFIHLRLSLILAIIYDALGRVRVYNFCKKLQNWGGSWSVSGNKIISYL